MHIMYERCAGLDVHKKTVVACVLTPDGQGGWSQEIRTFGTMTGDVLARSDWLLACGCTHVAIESTGEYWKPVFNILEGQVEVLLVNAAHVRNAIARFDQVKDVSDAERDEAWKRIQSAARKFDVQVDEASWRDLGKTKRR